MPELELKLRPSAGPPREAAAWYLPGGDVAAWLHEIAQWSVDHSQVRVVLVRGAQNPGAPQTVAGALVIPHTTNVTPSGNCLPFQQLGPRCYLPAGGELFPNISTAEITELFSGDYLYVWTAGSGLTAAEPEEVLPLSALVALPPAEPLTWDRAVPGVALPTRLVGILPAESFSVEEVIEEGRGDIGSDSKQIADLPKAPTEPSAGVAGAAARAAMVGAALPLLAAGAVAKGVGSAIASVLGGIAGAVGAGGGGGQQGFSTPKQGSSFDGLTKLANEMLRNASQALEKLRHREIGRLLNMLDSDPDQGLRYAIPFGGEGSASRGIAVPSGWLSQRIPNFSLGRLGGGGPADMWNIQYEYQQQLLAKYRELAAREIRLGRHRRAAYVYAELLGDFSSAASALEQGRHFREAAVLYRDKLHNPSAAATCLERGELWQEAIAAYQDLGQHEKVGDLCTQIEDHEAASEAYHAAANELQERNDRLGAARIYVEKLRDAELALKTLDAGWPDALQARKCVIAGFGLRGKLALHESARERIEALRASAEQKVFQAEVAEIFAEVFATYPDAGVVQAAADQGRRLIAGRLKVAPQREAERLVNALTKFSPQDRLLLRDGQRYLGAMATPTSKSLPAPKPAFPALRADRGVAELKVVRQKELGMSGVWRAAAVVSDNVYVAGVLESRLAFAAVTEQGSIQKFRFPWPDTYINAEWPIQLLGQNELLHLRVFNGPALPLATVFPPSDEIPNQIKSGTNIQGMEFIGSALGPIGQTWAIGTAPDLSLVCFDSGGAVLSTRSLLDLGNSLGIENVQSEIVYPIPMHVAGDRVLIGLGHLLLSVRNNEFEVLERFPLPITGLSGLAPYAAPLVAVSLERGAAVVRCGFQGFTLPSAEELVAPLMLMNHGGFIVAADETQVLVYQRQQRPGGENLKLLSSAQHAMGCPIAVLAVSATDQFVVVTDAGSVTTFQL